MPDKSTSKKFEDLTHQFHEKYRTTGIALCISLATVASAESWFFYGLFFKSIKSTENHIQVILWLFVIISAVCLFVSSFALQFLHYYGMKEMAQSFFHAYKLNMEPNDNTLKQHIENKWSKATSFFTNADWVVDKIKLLTIINFVSVILYIVIYQPIPTISNK